MGHGLSLGLVMEACVLRLLSVWIRSGFERSVWQHVRILRMLCVLSSLPVLPHAFALVLLSRRLPFDFAARPPHVFAPVLPSCPLPAHVDLLLEVAAAGMQIPIPASKTFCRSRAVY